MTTYDPGRRAADFVRCHPDAAVCSLRADGTVHTARVELAVVDGRIRSAAAPGLVRVRNLRRDPRCSLFVFGPHPHWLGLDAIASLLDAANGHDGPALLMAALRARHRERTPPGAVYAHDDELGRDRLFTEDEFLDRARAEGRFVVDFEISRTYGYAPEPGA